MEVDTGASVSIISKGTQLKLFPKSVLHKTDAVLKTYTGEGMTVLGELKGLKVHYCEQFVEDLSLIVVGGQGPGRNWLERIKLDWKQIGSVTVQYTPLQELLTEYKDVFRDELGTIKDHKVKLALNEGARPKFFKPRFALWEAVDEELCRLEHAGVLKKVSTSEWASPIVCVPKKDNKVRICGDYKVTINGILDVKQHPLPLPDDMFATLAGGKHFSKLDLTQAYNQLLVDEDTQKLLTINTRRGLYQYKRLPFGVASAPAIFQRVMDTLLQDIPHTLCYIDDIIVTGKSEKEHLENLGRVLDRLQENGVRVKLHKCEFLKPSIGHRIDAEGRHVTDDKLQAIVKAPSPRNVHELRSFLGLLKYYNKFIPNLASVVRPMYDLLHENKKWEWSAKCTESFKRAKDLLISPNVLVHYDPNLPIKLEADASSYGVGAVISHVMPDNSERPIAFASHTLTKSE